MLISCIAGRKCKSFSKNGIHKTIHKNKKEGKTFSLFFYDLYLSERSMPFSQYHLQELPFYDGFLKVRDNEGIACHFVITQSVILPLEVCLCVCVSVCVSLRCLCGYTFEGLHTISTCQCFPFCRRIAVVVNGRIYQTKNKSSSFYSAVLSLVGFTRLHPRGALFIQ